MHRVLFLALLCAAVSCVKRTEVQVLKANQPLCIYLRRPNLPKCPGTKIPTDDSEFPVKSLEVDNVLLYKKDLLRIKKFDKDVLESKKLQRKQIMIHTNLTSSYMGYIVANRCVPTTLISQCQKSPFSNQTVMPQITNIDTTVVNEDVSFNTDLTYINVTIFSKRELFHSHSEWKISSN